MPCRFNYKLQYNKNNEQSITTTTYRPPRYKLKIQTTCISFHHSKLSEAQVTTKRRITKSKSKGNFIFILIFSFMTFLDRSLNLILVEEVALQLGPLSREVLE